MTCTVPLSGWAKLTQTWRPSGRATAKTGCPWVAVRPVSSSVRASIHSTSCRPTAGSTMRSPARAQPCRCGIL